MELNEKIQTLRSAKNLTQEELAQALYVSRAAVSKWESGRGYPNIESLKALSKFFGVTIDELLSGEALLTIAEEDTKQKEMRIQDLIFGLLDCGTAMLFLLPFFGQSAQTHIQAVSLLMLSGTAHYIKYAYFAVVIASVITGILTLSFQSCRTHIYQFKRILSMTLNIIGTLLFVIGRQPYAAIFLFVFLIIKAIMLIKKQ